MFVGMLCLIYCLWIVMMAHKSKYARLLSSLSLSLFVQFDLCSVFFFILLFPHLEKPSFFLSSRVGVRFENLRWHCTLHHSSSLSLHRWLRALVTSNCPFILLRLEREVWNASFYLIDDEVLLSLIHKWFVCVMNKIDRQRERAKSP